VSVGIIDLSARSINDLSRIATKCHRIWAQYSVPYKSIIAILGRVEYFGEFVELGHITVAENRPVFLQFVC